MRPTQKLAVTGILFVIIGATTAYYHLLPVFIACIPAVLGVTFIMLARAWYKYTYNMLVQERLQQITRDKLSRR